MLDLCTVWMESELWINQTQIETFTPRIASLSEAGPDIHTDVFFFFLRFFGQEWCVLLCQQKNEQITDSLLFWYTPYKG